MQTLLLITITLFLCCGYVHSQAKCVIPPRYHFTLFSIESGLDTHTRIDEKLNRLSSDRDNLHGDCFRILKEDTKLENAINDIQIIFKNVTNNCYFCYHFFMRSPNVFQYRRSQCSATNSEQSQNNLCNFVSYDLETGFLYSTSTGGSQFNCKSLIEGIYQFTYRLTDQTGVCDSPRSVIKACQKQGSPLVDNIIFEMTIGWCPAVASMIPEDPLFAVEKYRWTCLGRWVDNEGNIWGAIQWDTRDTKFKYRCFTTRIDQQNEVIKQQFGMTIDANCKTMKTYYQAPLRFELFPAFDAETQLVEMQPGCKLPVNFTGSWFYPAEFNTQVTINSTHIYYLRRLDQYRWEEIYFVCKESQESRYLMTAVTKGKCDVDLVCFYFMPRHQNIIRFRMSRPFRLMVREQAADPKTYMSSMFREACHWNSFTLNYLEWVYEYFILDPPVPINCPIQGRFKFVQNGQQPEKYFTKIPMGVTPRPRMQVLCNNLNESDFYACVENPKQLRLDVERCMRLDFTGRPLSEYDVADNVLTCVGFWMEDTKSFLITYDPDDPITKHFRCWVYKRVGYHLYIMSRAQSGHCAKTLYAESKDPLEGSSLQLQLFQNERQFDGCPMNFDDGRDPYSNPSVLYVYQNFSLQLIPSISLLSILMTAVVITLSF